MNFGWNQLLAEAQEQAIAGMKVTQCQACFCVGPQNGQPACPCGMRNVKIVNGRYVRTVDLGPAPVVAQPELKK